VACTGFHVDVTESTVKKHVGRLLMKLDVRDRVRVAIYAHEHGIVQPGAATAQR
jgi:DNA-binding NarL/FixJ family response regulator